MKEILEAIRERKDFEVEIQEADFASDFDRTVRILDELDSFVERESAFLYRVESDSGPGITNPEPFLIDSISLLGAEACFVRDRRLVDAVLKNDPEKVRGLVDVVREDPYLLSARQTGTFGERVVVRGRRIGGLFSLAAALRRSILSPLGLSDSLSLEEMKKAARIVREILERRPSSVLALTAYEVDLLLAEVSDVRPKKDPRDVVWFKPLARALTPMRVSKIMKRDFWPNADRLYLYAQLVGVKVPRKWEEEFSRSLEPRHFRDRELLEKREKELLWPLKLLAEEAKVSAFSELSQYRKKARQKVL